MTYLATYLDAITSTELTEVKAALAAKSPVQVLGQGGAALTVPADTTEDILATISIAAGLMGANDALEITTLWSFTGSTNTKTMRVRLGGIGGTAFMAAVRSTGTEVSLQQMTIIRNRNAQNSQVGYTAAVTSAYGVGTQAVLTSAIDMTALQTVVITGQKASSGEALVLESYSVKLVRAPD